jgi:DNA-directed RNA polymerase sigma subunit (sigma70/sigma32)
MAGAKVKYFITDTEMLDILSEEEKNIIEMRLGIGSYDKKHTFQEICNELGCKTKAHASRVEERALGKLMRNNRKHIFYIV